jgi:hypothetical protein
MYLPRVNSTGGSHYTLNIVSDSAFTAMEAAQRVHPTARIESANDKGTIDIILNPPCVDLLKGQD